MAKKKLSRKRKLTVWFGAVMLLNTALFISLIEKSSGQITTVLKPLDPVQARPELIANCPVTITIQMVDPSDARFQKIFLTLRNDSEVPIRAFVLESKGEKSNELGNILTVNFGGAPLAPAGQSSQEYPIDRSLIEKEQSFIFSLDYVEFTNGDTCGDDKNQRSEIIDASRLGRLDAIARYRDSLKKDDQKWLNESVADNFARLVPDVSISGKSDEWKQSYRAGYRTILSYLRETRIQNPRANLSSKLVELESANSRSAAKKR